LRLLTVPVGLSVLLAGCGRSDAPAGPNVPAALLEQARADFAAGRYEQAADRFRRIIEADPTALETRKRLAYALAALGQFDQVDRVLRTAPIPPRDDTDEKTSKSAPLPVTPVDVQADLMLWRRAFNVYRYYYHVVDGHPNGVFRTAAIRDALEALALGELTVADAPPIEPLRLDELFELLQLWAYWDQVARDADLFPNRQWIPLLMVAEPERLRDRLDQLVELEQQTAGAVWLHPDEEGNWLAHPGAIEVDDLPGDRPRRGGAIADELTETAGPAADLVLAWGELARWLDRNVPSPAVTLVAAIRPQIGRAFDRRLVLSGRIRGDRLYVERIGVEGPAGALALGYAEFRRLRHANRVVARSSVETESLAGAYAAAGLPTTAFHVNEDQQVFADDRTRLACLLSYVRYGAALFDQPVVMTTGPTD